MKKLLSVFLCAALLLSTFTVFAFAEPQGGEGGSMESGLYTLVNGDLPEGEKIETSQEPGGPSMFVVNYTSGADFKGKAYYYYDPGYTFDDTYSVNTGYTGVFVGVETEHIIRIVIRDTCTGSGSFGISVGNGGFPFRFIDTNGGEAQQSGGQGQQGGPQSQENGPGGPAPEGNPMTAERDIASGDVFSGSIGDNSYQAAFELNGNQYVMAIARWSNGDPNNNGRLMQGFEGSAGLENHFYFYRAICFYKIVNGEPILVGDPAGGDKDAEELAAIKNAFGDSLSLTLMKVEGSMTRFPEIWQGTSISGWNCPYIYHIVNASMEGTWVFKATGTVNGSDLTVYSNLKNNVWRGLVIDATAYNGTDAVEFVNSRLEAFAGQDNPDDKFIEVWLPGSEIEGTIAVPEDLNYPVFLNGPDDDNRTSLKGNIVANNVNIVINFIDLVSAKEKTDTGNYGISGSAPGELHNSSFSGYYHAVHSEGTTKFGGYYVNFINDHVGIYADYAADRPNANSNPQNYRFIANDIAIEIKNLPGAHEDFAFSRMVFLNNAADIVNDSGRFYNVSYSFFYHNGAPQAYVSGDDTAWLPVVGGALIGVYAPVIACPLARDVDFNGYFIPSSGPLHIDGNSSGGEKTPGPILLNEAALISDISLLDGSKLAVVTDSGETLGTWSFDAE